MPDFTIGQEGEYPQPQQRIANLHIPMVSGFTTGRMFAQVVGISGYQANQTNVVLENTGATTFTVQLLETDDRVSGPRFNIGPAVALVPRGQKQVVIVPVRDYLEFKTTSGNGQLRAQLDSRLQWRQMAFDKTEVYPATVSKKFPDNYPFPNV